MLETSINFIVSFAATCFVAYVCWGQYQEQMARHLERKKRKEKHNENVA